MPCMISALDHPTQVDLVFGHRPPSSLSHGSGRPLLCIYEQRRAGPTTRLSVHGHPLGMRKSSSAFAPSRIRQGATREFASCLHIFNVINQIPPHPTRSHCCWSRPVGRSGTMGRTRHAHHLTQDCRCCCCPCQCTIIHSPVPPPGAAA
jgi:hypothetical protein